MKKNNKLIIIIILIVVVIKIVSQIIFDVIDESKRSFENIINVSTNGLIEMYDKNKCKRQS